VTEPALTKPSFWTTVPGILTGVAGVLGAIAAIAALFIGKGDDPSSSTASTVSLAEWAQQANDICAEAGDEIRALNIPQGGAFAALPNILPIITRADQKLQALPRPAGADAKIRQTLEASAQAAVEARTAYDYWASGDQQNAQQHWSRFLDLQEEVRELDIELGANVCAQPIVS
jgi:hypothetical protein